MHGVSVQHQCAHAPPADLQQQQQQRHELAEALRREAAAMARIAALVKERDAPKAERERLMSLPNPCGVGIKLVASPAVVPEVTVHLLGHLAVVHRRNPTFL